MPDCISTNTSVGFEFPLSPQPLRIVKQEAQAHAAEIVAGIWNVLPLKAVELATTARPDFVQKEDYLNIGRITLPRLSQVRPCFGSEHYIYAFGCACACHTGALPSPQLVPVALSGILRPYYTHNVLSFASGLKVRRHFSP